MNISSGMLDSYTRKSKHATVLCKESILKAQFNGTVKWLQTFHSKENLMKFAGHSARRRRDSFNKHQKYVEKTIVEVVRDKQDKAESKRTNDMRKLVKDVVNGEWNY